MFWPQLASAVAHWISHGTFTKSSVCTLPEILHSIPKGLRTVECHCITAEGRRWDWLGG